eukprot:UC1_evm1s1579
MARVENMAVAYAAGGSGTHFGDPSTADMKSVEDPAFELRILYASGMAGICELTRTIMEQAHAASPLIDWHNRDWIMPEPTREERFLVALPMINVLAAQSLLLAATLPDIITMPLDDLVKLCPQLSFHTLRLFYDLCQDGAVSCEHISDSHCAVPQTKGDSDSGEGPERARPGGSSEAASGRKRVNGRASLCGSLGWQGALRGGGGDGNNEGTNFPAPVPQASSSFFVADITPEAAGPSVTNTASYFTASADPIFFEHFWRDTPQLPAAKRARRAPQAVPSGGNAAYSDPSTTANGTNMKLSRQKQRLRFSLPSNSAGGQTRLTFDGHSPSLPTRQWPV